MHPSTGEHSVPSPTVGQQWVLLGSLRRNQFQLLKNYVSSDLRVISRLRFQTGADRRSNGNAVPRRRPDCLLGDRGYDAQAIRQGRRVRRIMPWVR